MKLINVGGGARKLLNEHDKGLYFLLLKGKIITLACFLGVDCALHGEARSVNCRPAPFHFVPFEKIKL
jgi:hypothetical protein